MAADRVNGSLWCAALGGTFLVHDVPNDHWGCDRRAAHRRLAWPTLGLAYHARVLGRLPLVHDEWRVLAA